MARYRALSIAAIVALVGCTAPDSGGTETEPVKAAGMSAIRDDTSQPDILKVAAGSEEHTTLVAAVQAAGLVDVLANPGPFTVFAPTNAAFDKLPAGTVADLLKAENVGQLRQIIEHHVTTSALPIEYFQDGQSLWLVDNGRETITKKDGETWIGGAKIIASVRASNGWVHVIDAVLVPAAK